MTTRPIATSIRQKHESSEFYYAALSFAAEELLKKTSLLIDHISDCQATTAYLYNKQCRKESDPTFLNFGELVVSELQCARKLHQLSQQLVASKDLQRKISTFLQAQEAAVDEMRSSPATARQLLGASSTRTETLAQGTLDRATFLASLTPGERVQFLALIGQQ